MIHDQLAFAAGDRIDERNPLVLPANWRSGPSASPAFSGSVAAEADTLLPAIEAILAERRRQFEEFGHTVEQDLSLRPGVLPARAIHYLVSVQEDLQFRRGDFIASARRHAAQAGAMVLAVIDYLDAGGGR